MVPYTQTAYTAYSIVHIHRPGRKCTLARAPSPVHATEVSVVSVGVYVVMVNDFYSLMSQWVVSAVVYTINTYSLLNWNLAEQFLRVEGKMLIDHSHRLHHIINVML